MLTIYSLNPLRKKIVGAATIVVVSPGYFKFPLQVHTSPFFLKKCNPCAMSSQRVVTSVMWLMRNMPGDLDAKPLLPMNLRTLNYSCLFLILKLGHQIKLNNFSVLHSFSQFLCYFPGIACFHCSYSYFLIIN